MGGQREGEREEGSAWGGSRGHWLAWERKWVKGWKPPPDAPPAEGFGLLRKESRKRDRPAREPCPEWNRLEEPKPQYMERMKKKRKEEDEQEEE